MRKRLILLLFLLSAVICGCGKKANMEDEKIKPFETIESAIKFVDDYNGKPENFALPISDKLQDSMGMNMAIITDTILKKNFFPSGFEQKDDYRIYKYKSMDDIEK